MSNNDNAVEEVCADKSVEKHFYQVTISHTMCGTVADRRVFAGSKAHAALLIGIDFLAELLQQNLADEVTMHNVIDHMNVDVELIV